MSEEFDDKEIERIVSKGKRVLDFIRSEQKLFTIALSKRQMEFLNSSADICMLQGGIQGGKSLAGAMQLACWMLNFYPPWYQGLRLKERPPEGGIVHLFWVVSASYTMQQQIQKHLLGNVNGHLGEGLIPKANIKHVTYIHSKPDTVELFVVSRINGGGDCVVRFKSVEAGRELLQAETVSGGILIDEHIKEEGIFSEIMGRTAATGAPIRITATPARGTGWASMRFMREPSQLYRKEIIMMPISEVEHIGPEERAKLIEKYGGEHSADYRTKFLAMEFSGGGLIYPRPWYEVTEKMEPSAWGPETRYLVAVDFSKGGNSRGASPFVALFFAVQPFTNHVKVFGSYRAPLGSGIETHVRAINDAGMGGCPVAWPHDGNQRIIGSHDTAKSLKDMYLAQRLEMLPEHATFEGGGISVEAGISMVSEWMNTGKLRLDRGLTEVREEYESYARLETGEVDKRDDHHLDALRYGCMSIRHARPWREPMHGRRRGGEHQSWGTDEDRVHFYNN